MQQVSNRLKQLSESATLAMARMSRELKAQGHNVIALSLGEPDFDTPEFIKESAKNAIDNNYSHYTPVPGLVELREAISKKLNRDNKLDYNPDQIVVSTGAKQSIANVCLSLLNLLSQVPDTISDITIYNFPDQFFRKFHMLNHLVNLPYLHMIL